MMKNTYGLTGLIKGFTVCLLVSPAVNGFEISADLYSDLTYSNNVSLDTTNTRDDVSQTLGLNVLFEEERKRFNADASFNLEEEYYYNDTYSNQTSLTTGFGILNFDIVENFLDWRTSFTRTQVLANETEEDTPDNREQRDILRTGPSISYRMTNNATLGASTNYTLVENSDPQAADTERANGGINYTYTFNSTTSFSLNGQYDEILDAEGDDELKNSNVNIGLQRAFSNGSLSFNYGRTQSWSDLSEKVKGNSIDFRLNRRRVFFHDFTLQYLQDISDSSIGFESDEEGFDAGFIDENGNPVDTGTNINATSEGNTPGIDIVTRKQFNTSMSRVLGDYRYVVSGYWRDQNYKFQSNDRKSRGLSLSITQNIAPQLSAGLSYAFALNDYVDQPVIGKDRTNSYRINSQYSLTQDLDLSAFLQYRTLANSHNQGREYEEFSTGITINWLLL